MLKQACIVIFFVCLSCCFVSSSENARLPADDYLQRDARSSGQWCYCCDKSATNSGCNKKKLGCYSRFYCQQQESLNPPECADGLVPVGKQCDYCCAGQGCNEYPMLPAMYSSSPHCPDPLKITQLTANGNRPTKDDMFCGQNKFNDVNVTPMTAGTDTKQGFYPWTVKLHPKHDVAGMCAGTIIDEQWIVTAAHCVKDPDANKYTVVAGEYSLFQPDTTEQSVTIEKIYVHPKYNTNGNGNYDMALIKTKYPIQFGPNAQPICLPSANDDFDGNTCQQAGWAITGYGNNKNVMQEGSLEVLNNKKCLQSHNTGTSETLCGYNGQGTFQGLCAWGDGSPLQCKKGNVWVLAGVATQGSDFPACLKSSTGQKKPIVFNNVVSMMPWIIETQIKDAIPQP